MPNLTIGIQVDDANFFSAPNEMMMDARSLQFLQIPLYSPITVSFGQLKKDMIVKKQFLQQPLLRINEEVANELNIPNGVQMHIRYDPGNRTLTMGPVLGILISKYDAGKNKQPFGMLSGFCMEVIAAAKQKGVLSYIFTLKDIDYEKQTVRGWYWQNGEWKQSQFPLPDCIYNRLSSRSEERRDDIQAHFSKLKGMNIPIFNERFLNKWQVYQALSADSKAKPYIPYTEIYRGFFTIKNMLKKYAFIYVKPTNGSMGQGIYRISKQGNRYICQYSTLNGAIKKTFSSLPELMQQLSPRLAKRSYLAQQGLSLIKHNESPVDFRALVQKDRNGQWSITSIVARTGSMNSIVSNVARGGSMTSVKKALARFSSWTVPSYASYRSLSRASKRIAKSLEHVLPGHYAELGIDLAVDENGKIWLLEINSKPSKTEDTVMEARRLPRPSVLKLFDYALYLEQFRKPKVDKKKLLRKNRMLKKKRYSIKR